MDALIRTKLASLQGCGSVEALPVVCCEAGPAGCNWKVPGWIGDGAEAERCKAAMQHYVEFLGSQFDIAEDR